jgi:hypothetical protein
MFEKIANETDWNLMQKTWPSRFAFNCIEFTFCLIAAVLTGFNTAIQFRIHPWHFNLTLLMLNSLVQFYLYFAIGLYILLRQCLMDDHGEQKNLSKKRRNYSTSFDL